MGHFLCLSSQTVAPCCLVRCQPRCYYGGYFVDVLLSRAEDYSLYCGWASPHQLKGLRAKTELSQENSAFRLQHRKPAWLSSRLAGPTDFWTQNGNINSHLYFQPVDLPHRFWTCQSHNSVHQFLKINHAHVHILTPYWFCFPGEAQLIQPPSINVI